MQLEPGTRLAHYEVLSSLGAGGMGEVYRAKDTKLGREVAIKLLLDEVSTDPERLARFEREAKVLASLNHPNIASLHAFERDGDTNFLVMELVEGETLADRIAKGSIPLDEALPIATQIAEALEAAHEAGVIHRDLKPTNIKVREDGTIKVLDFGLAKALDTTAAGDPSESPTLTAAGTQMGVIMGTAAYMSPEQARGRPVDRRADIWAFGAVLFEMLSGKRAFAEEDISLTLSAVLQREPDWDQLPTVTPSRLRWLLRRCLAKDCKERLHHIADVRIVLNEELASDPEAPTAVAIGAARHGLTRWLWPASLAAVAIATLVATNLLQPGVRPAPLRKFELPVGTTGLFGVAPSLSPDGSRLIYAGTGGLRLRELDRTGERQLAGTDGALPPLFWSPNGEWIGFGRDTRLWTVAVNGGDPNTIAHLGGENWGARTGAGAVWTHDGRVIYTTGRSGLRQVPARGGDHATFLAVEQGERDFHDLSSLPNRRELLFIIHGTAEERGDSIALYTGSERHVLLRLPGERLASPTYSPSGHLLFLRSGDDRGIWAVPFSLSRLTVTGTPFLVVRGRHWFTMSSDGTLAYSDAPSVVVGGGQLVLLDRSRTLVRALGEPIAPAAFPWPTLSPDGGRAAVAVAEGTDLPGDSNIWIHDLEDGSRTRLTFGPGNKLWPRWMPDGTRVIFGTPSSPGDFPPFTSWIVAADGTGRPRPFAQHLVSSVSPDGQTLALQARDPETGWDIWLQRADQSEEPRALFRTEAQFEVHPQFSPDGRFLVYASDETGRIEVYVTRMPEGEGKWQVSVEGGGAPRWSPRGDEIFYLQQDEVIAVRVQTEPEVEFGNPRSLFRTLDRGLIPAYGFDVSRDGKRFLLVDPVVTEGGQSRIVVVQNWYSEFDPEI